MAPQGIILSPGPCTPDEAGICLTLIEAAAGKIPVLGVCLGHQAIGQAFGGKVVRGARADAWQAQPDQPSTARACSRTCRRRFTATRYHSLIVEPGHPARLPRDHRRDRRRR